MSSNNPLGVAQFDQRLGREQDVLLAQDAKIRGTGDAQTLVDLQPPHAGKVVVVALEEEVVDEFLGDLGVAGLPGRKRR